MTREQPRASLCSSSPPRPTPVAPSTFLGAWVGAQLRACDPRPPPGGRGGRTGAVCSSQSPTGLVARTLQLLPGHLPTTLYSARLGWAN